VWPEDVALYADFLLDVSAEDLQLRFFACIVELSAAEAHKLSHLDAALFIAVDYSHEMAFIALDEDTGQMLGLVRLKDELDEKTAEFAILVRSRMGSAGC
jgi:acetyltransferase